MANRTDCEPLRAHVTSPITVAAMDCSVWPGVMTRWSSLGQFDAQIGQLEGFEGRPANVTMTIWRTSEAFESVEVAQRGLA